MTDINRKTELHFVPTASECQGVVFDDSGKNIAILYERTDGYGELFAAAPDLLNMCEKLVELLSQRTMRPLLYPDEKRIVRQAKKAIAKAKKE